MEPTTLCQGGNPVNVAIGGPDHRASEFFVVRIDLIDGIGGEAGLPDLIVAASIWATGRKDEPMRLTCPAPRLPSGR